MPQAFVRRPFRVRAGVLAALIGASGFACAAPPSSAPSQPVNETLHGVAVPDPYRNLENSKSPQTRAWLKEQGDHAAAQLAGIEGRDAMAARIEALSRASGDTVRSVVRMPGDRLYYLKRKAGENQFKLVMRQGLNPGQGAERVLVDPEQMAKASGVPHAINYFAPSWDGATLAYGVSAGGSEDASLHLMDVASGKPIGQPIPRVPGRLVHWTPDSRSITFNQNRQLPKGAPETEVYLDTTVFLLKAGDPASRARPLFGPLVSPSLKLDRLDVGEVIFSPGSRWMVARTTDTTVPEGRLYVAPLGDLGRKAVGWRLVSSAADKITAVKLHGDTLYLRSYAGAPRGKLLSVPAKEPVLARATEVVAEPERGVLLDFQLGRDAVYTEVRQGFNIRSFRHPLSGRSAGVDVAPKLAGSTVLADDPAHAYADVWVVNATWTDPTRMLHVRADGTTEDTGLLTTTRPPGAPELQVSEVMFPSHDGTAVPLAVVHRKGLVLDGENPTLLLGYGAYGFAYQASYDVRSLAWLERGGVIAYANVRGSGAFGDAWHRAGFKATKSNTWKDGVAAARWLIAQKYTSPKKLGIWGTSAGGIFVGRAVTTAPELFAAAIFDVGVMDAVRAEESANGITNTSEFGSSRNPAEFPALLEMSTYHNIKDGTPYPAVMLIHGINDPRVDVWHSAKAAARLQAATTSGKPVLMRLDAQAGHGVGSTAKQGYSKQADAYSFMLDQFSKSSPHKD